MHYLGLVSIQVSISVVQRVEINSLLQIHTHLRELVQNQRIMHVKSCDICRVIIVFAQGYMLIHTVNICMENVHPPVCLYIGRVYILVQTDALHYTGSFG